jgi:hypothetical protein
MLNTNERNAFSKAIKVNGAALVQRLAHGRYEVPSAERAGIRHIVTGTSIYAADLACTCEAAAHGRMCWHRAAVQLRKTQESAKAQVRRSLPAVVAPATVLAGETFKRAPRTVELL